MYNTLQPIWTRTRLWAITKATSGWKLRESKHYGTTSPILTKQLLNTINVNSNQGGGEIYILKQYHMWRTSLCANWRSSHPQPINKKKKKSISRGCAPRGSHIT